MTKIIKIAPQIIRNCNDCVYHITDFRSQGFPYLKPYKEIHFCMMGTYDLKEVKGKVPVYPDIRTKGRTYTYLKNPNEIPAWCPLEEYFEEK